MPRRPGESTRDPMVRLKIQLPRLAAHVVARPRLMQALHSVQPARVLLLLAPAGYGKTVLMAQWAGLLQAQGACACWLTLDAGDRDPGRFLSVLAAAMRHAGIDMAPDDATPAHPDQMLEAVLQALAAHPRPVTLLLDGYHHVAGAASDAFFHQVIALLPDHLGLIVSARQRPAAAAQALLGGANPVEIGGEMLRFTTAEAQTFLGGAADPDMVGRLAGWPVALHLARTALLQGQPPDSLPERLLHSGGTLWRFLLAEILAPLPDEVADFLLETSILGHFDTAIADELRGRDDSWRIIDRLEPLRPLLSHPGPDGYGMRYQPLFAAFLQNLLIQRRPGEVAPLHLRASAAFERAGLLVEAVRHASAAGAFERCAALVQQAGGWRLVLYGGQDQLTRLLDAIPRAARMSHPRLLIAEAYVNLKNGDLRDALTTYELAAGEVPPIRDDPWPLDEVTRDVLTIGTMVRAYTDQGIDEDFLESVVLLGRKSTHEDGLAVGTIGCAGAICAMCLGRMEQAEHLARASMDFVREANSVLALNYCFIHAGMASLFRGELRRAQAYLLRAKSMAAENFGVDSGLKASTEISLALANIWQKGAHGLAPGEFEQAIDHVTDLDGWFEIYAAGLDSAMFPARRAAEVATMDRFVALGTRLTQSRGLDRLEGIVLSHRLLRHLTAGDMAAADGTAETLMRRFPPGCWQQAGRHWRPVQDAAFALVHWALPRAPELALQRAEDALACARHLRIRLYELRALLLRAEALQAMGRVDAAEADIRSAVALACDESIRRPFLEAPRLSGLFARAQRAFWQGGGLPLEADFLAGIIDELGSDAGHAAGQGPSPLSPREHEVMQELARGLTNKEIARVLDMTENTVKFHLKNIFPKLGVDRRAHALDAYRALTLPPPATG